jgi:DNA replication protein DnaC
MAESCPHGICDGSGIVLGEDDVSRPCACRSGLINKALTSRLDTRIPKKFRGMWFDRKPVADMDPALIRAVELYVRDIDRNLERGRGLWFYGDVGTGKTSLAMLVSGAAERAGRSIAVYSVPRLLTAIRSTYGEGANSSYSELFDRLCEVDLLQLDDVGAERQTEWVLEQLYAIVNERWQSERAVVVTSNLSELDDLRAQIGARTVSRLAEMCEVIPVMGRDLRMSARL